MEGREVRKKLREGGVRQSRERQSRGNGERGGEEWRRGEKQRER